MDAAKLIKEAFHYDVVISPNKTSEPHAPAPTTTNVSRKISAKALDAFMASFFKDIAYAFDGKQNAYTNRKLDVESKEALVKIKVDPTSEKEFKCRMTYAATVDLSVLKK